MSKIWWQRPKKVPQPILSKEYLEEVKRGARVLKERVKKGHRNPQAYQHGPVKVYTAEERAEFVVANPEVTKLPRKSGRRAPVGQDPGINRQHSASGPAAGCVPLRDPVDPAPTSPSPAGDVTP